MSTIDDITDAEFEERVLRAPNPVLVDFWANWCGPCRQLHPILEEVNDELAGAVTILKLDAEANPETPAKYFVIGLPAMKLFRNGELVHSLMGVPTKPALLAQLTEFL